jgi:methionine-rich copper-binding protein CopC
VSSARTLLARAVAVLALGATSTMVAAPAQAHAGLVSVDPADGAALDALPDKIQLEFTDAVDPALSTVIAQQQGGESTSLELARGISPYVLDAALPDDLGQGSGQGRAGPSRWKVTYRVVSRDGHPVSGTTTFTARSDGSASEPSDSESSPPTAGSSAADGERSPWPLLAVGIGTLALLGVAIGAVMRLAGRGTGQ